jgi:hypothetical protein
MTCAGPAVPKPPTPLPSVSRHRRSESNCMDYLFIADSSAPDSDQSVT